MFLAIKGLSERDLESIRKHTSTRELSRGQVVFHEGDLARACVFVESGALKIVHRVSHDGVDDQVLGVIKPGGFAGEEALLGENARHPVTALAAEAVRVWELDREAFAALMVESMTAGTRLLLGLSKSYREALAAPEQQARVFVFHGVKGGLGNTTLAVNTAFLIRRRTGKRVLLLDLDLQLGNAHLFVGHAASPNLGRLIQLEEKLVYDRIRRFVTGVEGVDFLLSPDIPQEAELVTRSHLSQILDELSRNYDYIVIDLKPPIDEINLLCWDRADRLIEVARPNLATAQRLVALTKLFDRLNYGPERRLCLLNRWHPEREAFRKEIGERLGGDLVAIPDDPVSAESAGFNGQPWVLGQGTGALATALGGAVDRLVGSRPEAARAGGIFDRLKSLFAG